MKRSVWSVVTLLVSVVAAVALQPVLQPKSRLRPYTLSSPVTALSVSTPGLASGSTPSASTPSGGDGMAEQPVPDLSFASPVRHYTPTVTLTVTLAVAPAPVQGYRVVRVYPHDRGAFTQGLVVDDGLLLEGTGIYGQSSLREVDLATGEVLRMIELPEQYFGEGITVLGGRVYQLTWREHTGFVYDRESFELLRAFDYPTEGWGLTHDGEKLIMSDGTPILHFLDPETLEEIGQVEVYDGKQPVTWLNELEYVQGEVFANVWQSDRIARIDPQTGLVVGWIDLTGLLSPADRTQPVDVLNGIAYDATNDRLFVTGKWWPKLFEIELLSSGPGDGRRAPNR